MQWVGKRRRRRRRKRPGWLFYDDRLTYLCVSRDVYALLEPLLATVTAMNRAARPTSVGPFGYDLDAKAVLIDGPRADFVVGAGGDDFS